MQIYPEAEPFTHLAKVPFGVKQYSENLGFLALSGAFPDGERPDFKRSAAKLSQAGWLGQRHKSL